MGVRPPTGGSGDRAAVEFGIAAITQIVEEAEVDFLADASTLVRELDDPDVPFDADGRSIELSAAIEEAGERRFDSRRELLNALHPVLEAHRETVSTGWLASIRSHLPF